MNHPQSPEPVQILDQRIVRLLRDGRLRTPAQLATTLGAVTSDVEAALVRLTAQRRALRAGHALPPKPGYAVPWFTLWGLAADPASTRTATRRR